MAKRFLYALLLVLPLHAFAAEGDLLSEPDNKWALCLGRTATGLCGPFNLKKLQLQYPRRIIVAVNKADGCTYSMDVQGNMVQTGDGQTEATLDGIEFSAMDRSPFVWDWVTINITSISGCLTTGLDVTVQGRKD